MSHTTGRNTDAFINAIAASGSASRPNSIKKGYAAFGDSYAAGIGTGNSSTWGCRQGRYAYPDLISSTAPNIDFQNLACSGATVQNVLSGGPNSQVDAWCEDF